MMTHITPFDDVNRMFDRMSRQFDGMDWGDGFESMRRGHIDVDVADYDDELVVVADLPGFDKSDVDLTVREDVLTIRADRTLDRSSGTSEGGDSDAYVRRERRSESLRRSIRLPASIDEDATTATYTNGVLTVTLPKLDVDGDAHHIDIN
ncbi:Hsp20/alpha crystallin family protein [Halobaculum sp. P14]|uniref:Hsp20/alpha crystallin family protein n=1 Tax=Halobaculum sp. P14 TaxID=3421638 RepID=UPI003EB88928